MKLSLLFVASALLGVMVQAEIHLPLGYPCQAFSGLNPPTNHTQCPSEVTCDEQVERSNRYRSITGYCNNLDVNPRWGSIVSPFERLVRRRPLNVFGYPPEFSIAGSPPGRSPLPNARGVSAAVHSGRDQDSVDLTLLVMQFGQFLDHDITLTAEMSFCGEREEQCQDEQAGDGEQEDEEEVVGSTSLLDCCEIINSTSEHAKACLPIQIPKSDNFYHQRSSDCLDFKRSLRFRCPYGGVDYSWQPEQMNVITSFVDGSMVYGSDLELAHLLREGVDGLLKANTLESGLLPFVPGESSCPVPRIIHREFLAGDERVNENPGLQSMHTLWKREHNRLAKILKQKYQHLGDEELYMEARRYLSAELQNIVYGEFLPIVLGPATMKRYGLAVGAGGSFYDSKISPNIFNGFATAAFRFGHSLIPPKILIMEEDWITGEVFSLDDNFFNVTKLMDGHINDLIRGMATQEAQKSNNIISDAVRNFLFKGSNKFGEDLAARNIQRGRDHELGSYNYYRVACGLHPLPGSFRNPPDEFSRDVWNKLGQVYDLPDDIELFPGGMSELPVDGGVVGPTFACIIGEQFKNLKRGDRYFFTHRNVAREVRFCPSDLAQLRRRTIFDVICDNIDHGEDFTLQPRPFFKSGPENAIIKCRDAANPLIPEYKCLDGDLADDPLDHDPVEPEDVDADGEVVVLVGGHNGHRFLDTVEVFSASGGCQHRLPRLPMPTGFPHVIFARGNLLVCGGRSDFFVADRTCWKLIGNQWVEDTEAKLLRPRLHAAGVNVMGTYYASGGVHSPLTSEYFDTDEWRWRRGPNLKTRRAHHCAVANSGEMLLMGGGSNIVEEYSMVGTGAYGEKPPMPGHRHSCVLLPDTKTVLMFGGPRFTGLYHWPTGRSAYGDDTVLPRSKAVAVVANGRVLLLGGSSYSTRIEEFDPAQWRFKLVDSVRLMEARACFGAAVVPARVFKHLPGGCKA